MGNLIVVLFAVSINGFLHGEDIRILQAREKYSNALKKAVIEYQVPLPTSYFFELYPNLKKYDAISWANYRKSLLNVPGTNLFDAATPQLKKLNENVIKPIIENLANLGDLEANKHLGKKTTDKDRDSVDNIFQHYYALYKPYLGRTFLKIPPNELDEMCKLLNLLIERENELSVQQVDRLVSELGDSRFYKCSYINSMTGKNIYSRLKKNRTVEFYFFASHSSVDRNITLKEMADHGEWRAMMLLALDAYTGGGAEYDKKDINKAKYWLKKASERSGCQMLNDVNILYSVD